MRAKDPVADLRYIEKDGAAGQDWRSILVVLVSVIYAAVVHAIAIAISAAKSV